MSRSGFNLMQSRCYTETECLEERTFILKMRNSALAERTGDRFDDGNPDGCHPVFVLSIEANQVFRCCPCTSKRNSKVSYIIEGSRTTPDGFRIDRDSYLLHFFSFNLTDTDPLMQRLEFMGQVDEEDILGNYHNRGGK